MKKQTLKSAPRLIENTQSKLLNHTPLKHPVFSTPSNRLKINEKSSIDFGERSHPPESSIHKKNHSIFKVASFFSFFISSLIIYKAVQDKKMFAFEKNQEHEKMRSAYILEERNHIQHLLQSENDLQPMETALLVESEALLNEYETNKNDKAFKEKKAILKSKIKSTTQHQNKLNRKFAAFSQEESFHALSETTANNVCAPRPPAVVDPRCRVNEPCPICGGCCCGAEAFRRGLI